MNTWIALLLAIPAFAALSQAMERHHAQVCGNEPSPRIAWSCRVVGAALLLGTLVVCLQAWGTSVAVAAWLGVLTLAALTVGLVLTYAAHCLRGGALLSLGIALLGIGLRI
ncbi:DUF3325 domain-containing protein [Comamonas sp. NoAH]|uniref:DUF3325 domain-containing protein n=1 Tax=Comamonas halotolerans TaxID=3041496 RepID=UPI0024E07E91|nr:DUF3325 domain-containing protein [Comamonas sp. NoAH]